MNACALRTWTVRWCLVAGALLVSGCQHFQIPAFDPTGERIFSSSNTMQIGHTDRLALQHRIAAVSQSLPGNRL